MRPQKLALIGAFAVTAVFVIAAGVIGFTEFWPRALPQPARNAPAPIAFQLQAPIAPIEFDFPNEHAPVPVIQQVEAPKARLGNTKLSGPHAHGNLAIFFIHGEDQFKGRILTLQDGLAQGLAVVHETRGAQLRVDNRSNQALFVQSGDIIKGGTQDRTLPFDMIIPGQVNNVPLAALCVEQGRSAPRGHEISTSFQTSTELLPSRKLRLAASSQNQNLVWANVGALQGDLARSAGGSVQAALSTTSLQLTLEHPRVQDAVRQYLTGLSGAVGDAKDVIGCVAVVNGQIQSADVYGSSSLFRSMWPKLLKASAVDAIAERRTPAAKAAPTTDEVTAFLGAAETGTRTAVQGGHRGLAIRQESARHLALETCDPANANAVFHRSVIAK